jgi:hypothetical protein
MQAFTTHQAVISRVCGERRNKIRLLLDPPTKKATQTQSVHHPSSPERIVGP